MSVETELAAARAAGDDDRVADLLAQRANSLAEASRFEDARRSLEEAAAIHEARARPVDQARCLSFAATLYRATGDLDQARARASRAAEIAPDTTAALVSACTELGETDMLAGRYAEATGHFGRALEVGTRAGLTPLSRAALFRARARAEAAAGALAEAAEDLGEARALYQQLARPDDDRRTAVELASALQAAGRDDELATLLGEVRPLGEAAGDHAVLADLDLLAAARALDQQQVDAAIEAATSARAHALAGVVPTAYAGAAIVLAELREAEGDRVAAYESLAVGWATLGDLLGEDVARATFESKLQSQRQRWGDAAFIEARDAYYARRRADRTGQ